MFDQTFVNVQAQTRKPWTVLASLSLQAAIVLALLIAPLLRIAKLDAPPKVPEFLRVTKVDMTAQPDVKKTTAAVQQTSSSRPIVFQLPRTQTPTSVPTKIDMTPDAPSIAITTDATAGPASNVLAGLTSSLLLQRPREEQRPAPPAPVAPAKQQLHVGGDVQAAKLVYFPRPEYPRLAVTTRTQGTVVIRAVIARDGTIGNLQLISGPPLLVTAALEAVRQWRYKPTILNGEPVEVLTEINVNFTLAR